jgi:hypothetical protein
MTRSSLYRAVALVAIGFSTTTFAADQNRGGPDGGPQARGFNRPGAFDRGGMGDDVLSRTVSALADVNLTPEFNLTAEQKQSIAGIRTAFEQSKKQWQTAHAADLAKLDQEMSDLRDGGQRPDQQQMRTLFDQRRQVMSNAPTGDAEVKQILAILSPEEAKQLQTKTDELEKERLSQRNRFGGPGGPGGPGGFGGPMGGGPDGGPQHSDAGGNNAPDAAQGL